MTNVLLVSADRELRRFVRTALEDLPVSFIDDCGTSKEAIVAFREQRPKLVLVDLFIPESSGIEVIKAIKKLDDELAVVLLCRLRTRTIKDRAFRSGADDVLVIPMEAAILRDVTLHRLETTKQAEPHA